MTEDNNSVLLIEYTDEQKVILIREGIKKNISITTIDNKEKLHALSPSQLQKIFAQPYNPLQVYFRQPSSKNHQITDFGDWRYISMNDLLIDKTLADNLLKINVKDSRHHEEGNRNTMTHATIKITTEERYSKWREIAEQVEKEHSYGKEDLSVEVLDRLKKNNPEYITQSNGSFYEAATISRQIRKIKTRRK